MRFRTVHASVSSRTAARTAPWRSIAAIAAPNGVRCPCASRRSSDRTMRRPTRRTDGSPFKDRVQIKAYPVQARRADLRLPRPADARRRCCRWTARLRQRLRVVGSSKSRTTGSSASRTQPNRSIPSTCTATTSSIDREAQRHRRADAQSRRRLPTHFIEHDCEIGKYRYEHRCCSKGRSEKGYLGVGLPLVFPTSTARRAAAVTPSAGGCRSTTSLRWKSSSRLDPGPASSTKQDPVPYVEIEIVDAAGRFTALERSPART